MSNLTKQQLKATKKELVALHRGYQIMADKTAVRIENIRKEIRSK